MSWKILQIAVGSTMFALLMGAVLVTAVLTARRPGRWRPLRAVAFALGWPLLLIPMMSQFYVGPLGYGSATANGQGANALYAQFDMSVIVGMALISALLMPDIIAPLFRKDVHLPPQTYQTSSESGYRFCTMFMLIAMNTVLTVGDSPGSRYQSAAETRADPFWWFSLALVVIALLLAAITEMSLARDTANRAHAALATRQRVEQGAAAEEGE